MQLLYAKSVKKLLDTHSSNLPHKKGGVSLIATPPYRYTGY